MPLELWLILAATLSGTLLACGAVLMYDMAEAWLHARRARRRAW